MCVWGFFFVCSFDICKTIVTKHDRCLSFWVLHVKSISRKSSSDSITQSQLFLAPEDCSDWMLVVREIHGELKKTEQLNLSCNEVKSDVKKKSDYCPVLFHFIKFDDTISCNYLTCCFDLPTHLPIHLFTSCNLASNATPSTYLSPT